MVSRNCSLRFAILFPLSHKVGPGVDIILRLPDRLTFEFLDIIIVLFVLLIVVFFANSGHHVGILKTGVGATRNEGLFL